MQHSNNQITAIFVAFCITMTLLLFLKPETSKNVYIFTDGVSFFHNSSSEVIVPAYDVDDPYAAVSQRVSILRKVKNHEKKKVISFGIYGANPRYTLGAISNAQMTKIIYPGFIARFYVDDTVPLHIIRKLVVEGAEIIYPINPVNKEKLTGASAGMFWRFLAAIDPTVSVWLIRDADSRLSSRERYAVDEWLQSGKSYHIMRDHPHHIFSILGGMWGGRKPIPNLNDLILKFENKANYLGDMQFLDKKVWPLIKEDVMAHDNYHCQKFPEGARPFPTQRIYGEHVGQVYLSFYGIAEDQLAALLSVKEPKECQTPTNS